MSIGKKEKKKKMNLNLNFTTRTKIFATWITDLNVRGMYIKYPAMQYEKETLIEEDTTHEKHCT